MKRTLGVLFLLIFCSIQMMAQIPFLTEQQARAELEKRGIDEQEFTARLQEKGVDIYNIDPTSITPIESERIQQIVEDTLKEMEEEKAFEVENDENISEDLNRQIEGGTLEEIVDDTDVIDDTGIEQASRSVAEDNEVEKIVKNSIYGQQIFRDRQIDQFLQSRDLSPPDSYVLGAGDKISVSIWGTSVLENRKYEVGEDGYIRPSRMRPIYLKGISLGKAKTLIQSGFRQRYQFLPEQFDMTLDYARTVSVNIVGDVVEPGTYSVPALNSAINALMLAGGPSNIGSLREIQLRRDGEEPVFIDIYEYLNNPTLKEALYLQNNDFILVPVADKVVQIGGGVKRSMKYELLESENLIELIDYAGGLVDSAYQSNIQIYRYANDTEEIIDVNLKKLYDTNTNFPLLKGDRVSIKTIPKPYENYVLIEGEVLIPGKFQLTNGMRVKDLIERAVLTNEAKTDRVFLKRFNLDSTIQYVALSLDSVLLNDAAENNILLRPKDELMISNKKLYTDRGTVTIRGAVRNPIELPLDAEGDLTLEEAILLAGGLDKEAYSFGYLQRKDPKNKERTQWKRFNINEALENPNSAENFALMPLDTIDILSNPTFTDQYEVRIAGAVRNPGDIAYDETLTLKDVLTLAGGLKLEAAYNQIEIFRLVIQENQPTSTIVATVEVDEELNVPIGGDFPLAPFDLIVVRSVPDFEYFQTVNIEGEILYPGPYALLDKNERLLSVLERAGGLTEEAFPSGATLYRTLDSIGYVVMELDEVLQDKDSRYNFILKEGDIIYVPKQEDLVAIQGEIRARELYPEKYITNGRINTAYHDNKRANFYIREYAAGVGEDGKRGLVTVEHPNGQIERTVDLFAFKIYPKVRKGSVITVGRKPYKDFEREQRELEREPVDWGRVLSDSIGQAGSILSLILLIQRL